MSHQPTASRPDPRKTTLAVITAIMLTFTYIALGLTVCAGLPFVTDSLSTSTSNTKDSPYAPTELTALALETRDFTVGDYERDSLGREGAEEALAAHVLNAARRSCEDPQREDLWSSEARTLLEDTASTEGFPGSQVQTMEQLAAMDPAYGLDQEALDHLDDVNDVLSRLMNAILGIAVLSAFCLFGTLWMFGPSPVGRALRWAAAATILLFALMAGWAALSFESLFSFIHSLFFAAGSWTFPADSLLISMYPTQFWVGMALYWFAITMTLATLSWIIGTIITKRQTHIEKRGPAACLDEDVTASSDATSPGATSSQGTPMQTP